MTTSRARKSGTDGLRPGEIQDTGALALAQDAAAPEAGALPTLAAAAGYVLAVSYPVLAISTGVRALYQLFVKDGGLIHSGDPSLYLGPLLSALAASLYLVATVGFVRRTPRAWWVSVSALGLETALTLLVGTLTLPGMASAATIGGTVWRWYGADYGFFPLFQPLLGLLWLFWPVTMDAYGIDWLPPWRRGRRTA